MQPNPGAASDLQAWHAFRNAAEGGLSTDPNDSGNWLHGKLIGSNRGVTPAVLEQWRGKPIDALDMDDLTAEEADAIAEALFWQPCGGDYLPSGVNLLVADFGWGSGVVGSVRRLQTCLGFVARDVDGIVGPETLLACKGAGIKLIGALHDSYAAYYRSLNSRYLAGWLNRNDRRRDLAMTMAAEATT